jgi:hypothetical protein
MDTSHDESQQSKLNRALLTLNPYIWVTFLLSVLTPFHSFSSVPRLLARSLSRLSLLEVTLRVSVWR